MGRDEPWTATLAISVNPPDRLRTTKFRRCSATGASCGSCKSGDIVASVYETADAMLRVKRKLNDAEKWRAFVQGDHFAGLRHALREDPFSNRAVTRPRGYPGDAILLDMTCRIVGPTETTSTIGKMAFEATTNARAAGRCAPERCASLSSLTLLQRRSTDLE